MKTTKCLTYLNKEIIKPCLKKSKRIQDYIKTGKIKINCEPTTINENTSNFSKHFVFEEIRNHIYNNINYVETLTLVNDTTTFQVKLFICRDNKTNTSEKRKTYLKRISHVMSILIEMSKWSYCNIKSKHVIVNLFDIDKNKEFIINGENITPDHVNSAYTIPCRHLKKDDKLEVVIFRNEELIKVLFHELMHLYSYDIKANNYRVDIRLSRIFNVNTKFNLTEAYCEFWARLLWTLFKLKGNFRIRKFREEMEKQKKWSIQQALIVMTNMDIMDNVLGPITDENGNRYIENDEKSTYTRTDMRDTTSSGLALHTDNIMNTKKCVVVKQCKETTSAFSYYVIAGFLISEWENVLYWCCNQSFNCKEHINTHYNKSQTSLAPLLFNNSIITLWSFISLIREIVNDSDVIEEWNEEEDNLPDNIFNKRMSARMSI